MLATLLKYVAIQASPGYCKKVNKMQRTRVHILIPDHAEGNFLQHDLSKIDVITAT